MSDVPHRLKVRPAEFSDGFLISSNGRVWGLSRDAALEIVAALSYVIETGQLWQNYEEPKREPLPPMDSRPSKPTLNDILDLF